MTNIKMMMMMMMIIIHRTHSVHSLISLYISVPHPSQSQATLYNHQSTHLHFPLLPLPVSGRLMAVLPLYMICPAVGKSQCSYPLSEMS
jgi:hypothetical protein